MLEEDDLDGNYVNNLISDLESNSFYVPRKLERIRLRKTYKTVQRSQRRRAATRVASDPEKLRKERQRDENSRHSLIGAYRIFRQNCLRRIREGAIGWEPDITKDEWIRMWMDAAPGVDPRTGEHQPAWLLRGPSILRDVQFRRRDTNKSFSIENTLIVQGSTVLWQLDSGQDQT